MRRFFLYIAIISLVMAYGIVSADIVQGSIDDIQHSIEKSLLSQEKKAILHRKAKDALNVGIQPDDIAIIINRGIRHDVDVMIITSFVDTVIKMKTQSLPVRPVLDRIQQGLSKRVPSERILDVVLRLAEKLVTADGIVNSLIESGLKIEKSTEKKEDAVQIVARALERSIPENIIIQVGIKARKLNYSVSIFNRAIGMMSAFVESGMSVEQALRLVNKAMDKGYTEKDMLAMEKEIASELKEGKRVEDTLRTMESIMDRGGFDGGGGTAGGQMRGTGPGTSGPGTSGSGIGSGSGWSGPDMQRR